MRHPHDRRAHGWWQFLVFGLSVVVAFFVYVYWPEPEESVRGYTPSGCHEQARELFVRARVMRDVYRRSELNASAVKYLEALEERFGVSRSRWDAYEMLGDAHVELAAAAESDREVARRLRLRAPAVARDEALRAFRAATALLDTGAPEGPRLLRKTAEMLVALGRPGEATGILRELVKLYRRDQVESLRRERGETAARPVRPAAAADKSVAGREDEVRRVYFLAGTAALAAARDLESRRGFASDPEAVADAEELRREAGRAFTVFLDSGGAGERRAAAETSLGDLALARASATPDEARIHLEDAARHYRSAGTPVAEFLRARAFYAMGDYEKALRIFRRSRAGMAAAERRARRYMEARSLLALGRAEGGDGAAKAFRSIHADDPDDAEGAASLVGLADVAIATGDLDEAARFLEGAAARSGRVRGGAPLPERDRVLEPAPLAKKLATLADALERNGEIERAVGVFRKALKLDPSITEVLLRKIARAWEGKAEDERAAGREDTARAASADAAEAYVALARVLPARHTRLEARARAADLFAEGRALARAVGVARGYVTDNPQDAATSRMLHLLAGWETKLGLLDEAATHLKQNVDSHWSDVHADRSLVDLVELLYSRGRAPDLAEARKLLGRIFSEDGRYGERYARGTRVRLWALFALGRVDVRLADREEDPGKKVKLLREASSKLDEALAEAPGKYPLDGPGARPRFRELIDRERPRALVARGRVLYGLASLEPDEGDRRARLSEAAAALGEADRASGARDAELHLALVECRRASDGDEKWDSARAALERLRTDARAGTGILPVSDWQKWSAWIAERRREGRTDGAGD